MKYTLIRDCSASPLNDHLFAVPTEDIIVGPLADCYDDCGQQWGHEGAGDWCLGGDPEFYQSIIEHLQDVFGWKLEDDKIFYVSDDGKLFDTENMTDDEIKAVEKEIADYCKENSKYYNGTYYTYWNGSRWKSILFDIEDGHRYYLYEIVDGDEAEEIINDYKDAEFIEEVHGIKYYQGKLHKYSVSRWQGIPWSFEVEED